MSTTLHRLSDLLARDYQVSDVALGLDTPLESLGIDSLATVELLFSIEDAFGIKLSPDPAAMKTVGDVVQHVDEVLAAQASTAPAAPAAEVRAP